MPYQPLRLPDHLSPAVRGVVQHIEEYFDDFHHLLTIRRPDQGQRGSFQRSYAVFLFSIVTGLSTMLYAEQKSSGQQFIGLLQDHYPWDLDPPDGLDVYRACVWLFNMRNAFVHRFGMSAMTEVPRLKMEFGLPFCSDDSSIEAMEGCEVRPTTKATIGANEHRVVLWLHQFY